MKTVSKARRDLTRRSFLTGAAAVCGTVLGGGCASPFGRTHKFALNASTLRGYSLGLTEQVKAAIAGGFSGYEPWLKDVRAAKAAGRLREAVQCARDGGLQFVNGIAFGRWVDPDPAIRKTGLEETKRDMALLAEMNCPYIAASMFGVHKPGSPILSMDEIAERFAALCELGDEMGVTPLLEYWGHSVNLHTPEAALNVLAKVRRNDTALLADVYHTYRGGGSFGTFRDFTGGVLPVLHVNDYPATPAREKLIDADRVWPGDGIAPWQRIIDDLDAAGANPWLSIEVFNPLYCNSTPDQTARRGREKLLNTVLRTSFASCQSKVERPMTDGLQIGVQMWSVDELWKKNPSAAFRRLRALGYLGVQSFGFYSMDWDELEKMLDGEGLQIVDMPFFMKTLKEDEAKFLAFCERFKIDFVFEPWSDYKSLDAWQAHAKELMAIRARFAQKGLRVGYHNHQHEIRTRYEGKSPAEILDAAGLDFELDVGHVKLAGSDPVAWLRKLSGRVPTIHAKPGGGDSVGGRGDQNNWPQIFDAAYHAGTRWAIVECETRRNTFEDVERSMEFMKGFNA